MAKLTIAKINEMAREVAMKEIADNGLTNFLQVEGTKFAKDFTFDTPDGQKTKTVRIDVVVPKFQPKITTSKWKKKHKKKKREQKQRLKKSQEIKNAEKKIKEIL